MDQKNEHFRELSAAQDRVTAECWKLAALSRSDEHEGSEEADEGLKAVQDTIDAIDRVLRGQPGIASGKLLSFPPRALHQPPTSVAGNHARATAGSLASEQAPRAEVVKVYSSPRGVDIHFRLIGAQTDLPIGLTRRAARDLLERLTRSLARGADAPRSIRS